MFLSMTPAELKGLVEALGQGIFNTLWVSILGTIIGLMIGLVFGLLRVQSINPYDSLIIKFLKKFSNFLIKGYVTIFRGTPMILQAILFKKVFTMIFGNVLVYNALIAIPALITVSINTGAYLTEVIRNSIQSVDRGQLEGARAIGMSQTKAMWFVIFPQAIKNSFASIGNEFIINIKDTSVLQIIGFVDLFNVIEDQSLSDFNILFWYLIGGAIYLVLTYGCSKILNITEKKIGVPVKEITSSN